VKISYDLHIHSALSPCGDEDMTPNNIVNMAYLKGLDVISITDHNSVLNIKPIISLANEYDILVIPGIEITTREDIHILGYFKGDGYKNSELLDYLSNLKNSRLQRATLIVENLEKYFNIKIDLNRVLELGEGVVGRPHLAQAIIEAGYPYTWDYIFDKFINKNSPAYVENKKISIPEGINLLKKYGCIVILAHPKLIRKTPLKEILRYDFDGIEAIYFLNFKQETDTFKTLCRTNNLLMTCGSDFHGILSGDTKHGTIGDMSIDESYFNKFISEYEK